MTQKVDDQKVITEFDNRAEHHKNENAVLDAGNSKLVEHQNVFRNYYTKQTLKKHLSPSPSDTILDFGCGVGRLSNYIAPFVNGVVGIDKSLKMIDVAREINARHKNVSYQIFGNYPLPFSEKYFDKIFTYWVLQHIDNDELKTTFLEFRRILKDTGKVYLFEQVRNSESVVLGDIHHQRRLEEYVSLMRDAGFKLTHNQRVFRYPSYALSLWSRFTWMPAFSLPILAAIEANTVNRKPQHIEYSTDVMIFQKA